MAIIRARAFSRGIDTGLIPVPSLYERGGNLSDRASSLSGDVSGPYHANLLTQGFGYCVAANEPHYFPGCTTPELCVFPNAIIPQGAWSEPAKQLLQYISAPDIGDSIFSIGAEGKTLRDDKDSFRIDGCSRCWGLVSLP